MRPMWYDFPDDPETFSLEEQFMIGSSMIVAPVFYPHRHMVVAYLPSSCQWYNFFTKTIVPESGEHEVEI